MQTLSQWAGSSFKRRFGLALAVSGAGTAIATMLDVSPTAGVVLAGLAILAVNGALWLRQNPTLKQIERRRRRPERTERPGTRRPDGD